MLTKKVLFIIAHKEYQPTEYAIPKKLLEDAGFSVTTASDKLGMACATDETKVAVDILVQDAVIAEYDGVFLVGGAGALDCLDTPITHALVNAAVKEHKAVGAICISTRILAAAGILKDCKATGWNGDNQLLEIYQKYGALYTPHNVVVDKHIVTASGPNVAREYGEQIITLLQDNIDWH
jgi:protease I